MEIKTTPLKFKTNLLQKTFLALLLVGGVVTGFGQTITKVSPTIITTGSKVTITGSGFTTANRNAINVDGMTIRTNSRTLVSPEVMTFIISNTGTSDIFDKELTIGSGINATQKLTYIAPTDKHLDRNSDYLVEEIYTNWYHGNTNDFWRSSEWWNGGRNSNDPNAPDNNHELLGFKMKNGVIYSTGVDDQLLEQKLSLTEGPDYHKTVFKAYSTNGIQGKTDSGALGTYIIAGDALDGLSGSQESPGDAISNFPNIDGLKVFDVIIDGKHGLNLGTGITNINATTDVQFFSGNGQPGALGDAIPDLLITQMADAAGFDIYFYADVDGDIIGRPIRFSITEDDKKNSSTDTRLGVWKIDLFQFAHGVDFAVATPTGRIYATDPNLFKSIRMAAFKLQDFEITTSAEFEKINNINMNGGGSADIAFIAYNQETFNIKSPVAKALLPKFVCRVSEEGGNKTIIFELIEGETVGVEDDEAEEYGAIRPPVPDSNEELSYEWSLYNDVIVPALTGTSSYSIFGAGRDDLGTYKIKISNGQGTIILPVSLSEGGTPYEWKDDEWKPLYDEAVDSERSLVFQENYDGTKLVSAILAGCDCVVPAGSTVTIPVGKTLKLFGTILVEDQRDVFDLEENFLYTIPAGSFTLENNASLVQIKDEKKNEGDIVVYRNAKSGSLKKYDYIYWSSPVEEAGFSALSGQTSHVYEWDVNFKNTNNNTRGNWVSPTSPTGNMVQGRGYIKRVNEIDNNYAKFEGVPNNGEIEIPVYKTVLLTGESMNPSDKHSNLIGNPYPSAIFAETFLEENENLEGYVLIWTHNLAPSESADNPYYQDFKYSYGDQYTMYNKIGAIPPDTPSDDSFNGKIASGQGFVVKVDNLAPSSFDVQFTNTMRYDTNEEPYNNTNFYRPAAGAETPPGTEKQLVWLSLVNEQRMASITLVGYAEGATNGKDRLYDAASGAGDMRLYSIIEDADFTIQGRALPFDVTDKVVLGVDILQNGIYDIGINHLKGSEMLSEAHGIYLEDAYTNTIHDLKKTPYSFTSTAGSFKDRFVLRYTAQALSVDDSALSKTWVYVKNEQLYISASQPVETLMVHDLTGKLLLDYKPKSDRFNVPFQFPKGAYLTTLKMGQGKSITKKIMN